MASPMKAVAQSIDSLIQLKDIQFKSDYEKKLYYLNFNSSSGKMLLPLFLSYSQKDQAELLHTVTEKLDQELLLLKKFLPDIKSEEKLIRYIHTTIHRNLLNKYVLNIDFDQIFENGTFNCVTATALYSYFLDELKIPYTIREKPSHVYIIAYPNTSKIYMETTVAAQSYIAFNAELEKEFLKSLLISKMITEEELKNTDRSTLFNKHFFSDTDISFRQLAGLHYCNHGILDIDQKNYKSALENFKKGYALYPSKRTEFLLKNTSLILCNSSDYKTDADIQNFITVIRASNASSILGDQEQIVNEFSTITNKQLISDNTEELYTRSYYQILKELKDSVAVNQIMYIFNYNMAWVKLSKGVFKGVEVYLKEAYTINSKNAHLQNLIGEYIRLKVNNMSDPSLILKLINDVSSSFDFLNTHLPILTMKSNCYLFISKINFASDNLNKGEENLQSFQKIIKIFPDIEVNENFTEDAYQAAAGCYFRKGNYSKAKEKFRVGLTYAPSSYKLKDGLEKMKGY